MAEYEARVVELRREVTRLREEALERDRTGGLPAVLATYIRLDAGIASYGEWRDGALKSTLALIKPDPGATATGQRDAWVNTYNQRGSEAFRTLTGLTSRDEDTIRRPFEILAMQESLSFVAMTQMPMAGFVGRLREHIREFETQHGYLHNTWRELTGGDERADGEIASLRVELLNTFKDGVEEARGWAPKIEEAIRKAVGLWKVSDDLSPDPPLSEPVVIIMKTLATLQQTLEEVTQKTLQLYDSEKTIIGLFGNVRQQVQEYLRQVNPDMIAREHADACRGTRDAAGTCPKDGQKTDLHTVAEKIISASDDTVREFNAAFEKFYSAFQGKFTGEVSAETVELLCEQEFFNQYWKDIESLNLPGVFRQVSEDLTRCESIAADQMTPEQKQKMQEVIRSRLAELQEKIRSYDLSFVERVKVLYVGPARESLRNLVRGLPGFRK